MHSAATVKLGENQFEKLSKSDRNNLLGAMYETLSKPSIVLEKETLDEKSGEFRPVHVYGKSFVREDSNHKRAVESVIIFKDGENISIGTHNKHIKDFVKQIKTADQIIFADPEISRVASLVLQNGGSHVRLQDALSNRAINLQYDKNKLLSIKDLQFSNADEMLQQKGLPHESRADLSKLVYEHAELEVNGKMRTCEHGLRQGFVNAVRRNDELHRHIEALRKENRQLLDEVKKRRLNRSAQKSGQELEFDF